VPGKTSKKPSINQTSPLPRILILAGIVILVAIIFILKREPPQAAIPASVSAEVQLDQHLKEQKPTFVFFHSNNCQSCIDMIAIVDQVYPDFKEEVALVDVNVYDPVNETLLRRAGISSIPTQLFIDRTGQGKVIIGVMAQDQLKLALQGLAGGTN